MKKIGMGVIGTGNISGSHIKGIKQSPDAELVAVCDIDKGVLKKKGDLHGIPEERRFTDYKKLLECPAVDAVSITTPNNVHFPIAMEAIRQNKAFALEKPVGMNYGEAVKIQEAAKEKSIPNIICFSYRYKSAMRYARSLIKEGYLGEIYQIYGKFVSGKGLTQPLIWRFQKEITGTGVLGDRGSHLVDIARFLVGDFTKLTSYAKTLVHTRRLPDGSGYGDVCVDDFCDIIGELEGGASASLSVSRLVFARQNYMRVEVTGSKGGLIFVLDDQDEGIGEGIKVCIGDVYEKAGAYRLIPVPKQYDAAQMQSLFDIINGKPDPLTPTINDGVINQRVLDAAVDAFEQEKWVYLQEAR